MIRVILVLLAAFFAAPAVAQRDSLELDPRQVRAQCAVTHMELADSFSVAGDSINASRHYLQIDPFFFVSSLYTPETIDSTFTEYRLTAAAKAEYRKIFATAYHKPRTEAYLRFKVMQREDKDIRNKMGAGDSSYRAYISRQMEIIDSPHFEYLHQYVRKHGWPTYEDGAMWADVIAMHDGPHMREYLPYVRAAVYSGIACPRFYYNLLNRAHPLGIERLKQEKNKIEIDVSYTIKGEQIGDKRKEELHKLVLAHRPVKRVYFVYETHDENAFRKFMRSDEYWAAWGVLVHVGEANHEGLATAHKAPYGFMYKWCQKCPAKLTLIIAY